MCLVSDRMRGVQPISGTNEHNARHKSRLSITISILSINTRFLCNVVDLVLNLFLFLV